MNIKALKQWRDDLRSGRYQQEQGSWGSRDKDTYCCLSVLACNQLDLDPRPYSGEGSTISVVHNLNSKLSVCLLGADAHEYSVPKIFGQMFSELNDGTSTDFEDLKLTFDEIADLIDIAILEQSLDLN